MTLCGSRMLFQDIHFFYGYFYCFSSIIILNIEFKVILRSFCLGFNSVT
jgi:hypothetical protein